MFVPFNQFYGEPTVPHNPPKGLGGALGPALWSLFRVGLGLV